MNISDRIEIIRRLVDTRNIIEGGWTRGAFVRQSNGKSVAFKNEHGARYCLTGACRWATITSGSWSQRDIFVRVRMENYLRRTLESDPITFKYKEGSLETWNDEVATKKLVLRLIERTVERLESGEETGD